MKLIIGHTEKKCIGLRFIEQEQFKKYLNSVAVIQFTFASE